jgi:hypothetical protein
MPKQKLVLTCLLLTLGFNLTASLTRAAKRAKSPCSKPPEMVSKQPLSKEEQERAKNLRPQGSIAFVISEEGDVIEAKVVRANSDEAGKILIDLVKGMKFKPRSGCGQFRSVVNFNLSD